MLDFDTMSTTHSPSFVPQTQQKKTMDFNATLFPQSQKGKFRDLSVLGTCYMPQPQQRRTTDLGPHRATTAPQSQLKVCKYHPEAHSKTAESVRMRTKTSIEIGLVPQLGKTGAHMPENLTDANDYAMLIKTQQESEHDYQSLQPMNQLSDKDPDYDYTSSWEEEEDSYQPLLMESIKPVKHSRDSTYQTLFSYPDP